MPTPSNDPADMTPMPTPEADFAELATFDPPLARAVVTVLRGAGLPASLGAGAAGQAAVLVPPERRGEAFAIMAARMDDIHAETAGAGAVPRPAPPPEPVAWADDGADHRPLVLERFRRFGWVAVALVPLLVITLANVRLPAGMVLALVVGSVVLLSAWRSGRMGGGDHDR